METETIAQSSTAATAKTGTGTWSRGWLMAGLMGVGLLHAGSLFNPFFIDDYIYLDTVHDLSWSGVGEVLDSPTMDEEASGVWWTPDGDLPFYRPLAILTFAVDYAIWGMNPFGYHLTNLLLHLLCVVLVWYLAKALLGLAWALPAATLFAVHPAHCEAVFWISGRFDLLVCACVVGSILAYLRWQGPGGGGWWGALSLLLFVVGLGCKETAIILPGVLVVCELIGWRGKDSGYRWGSLAWGMVLFGGVSVAYLAERFSLFGGLGTLPPPYGVDIHAPGALGLLLWNLAQYLLDFVLFIQIDAIYLATFWQAHAWVLVFGAGVCVVVVGWCLWLVGRVRGCWVGVVFASMFTAPALLAMPGERNIYLACVGVALVGACVFRALVERGESRNWGTEGNEGTRELGIEGSRGGVGWVLKGGRVFVVVCAVILVPEQVLMWRVSRGAERVYQDLLAALPDPPPDARIFVVNQCPLNAVGFTQGVKLRYGRDDVVACALAVSPQLEGLTTDRVVRTGDSRVRVIREGGAFFNSFVERFLMFSRPDALKESASRVGLSLVQVPQVGTHPTEIEFELPRRLDDDGMFLFVWENGHMRTLADLIWFAEWPRLVACPILAVPPTIAARE